jgi:hypothetical protein
MTRGHLLLLLLLPLLASSELNLRAPDSQSLAARPVPLELDPRPLDPTPIPVASSETVRRPRDPGILLELNRTTYQLTARDLSDQDAGPALKVVLGSPAHPTPAGSFPIYQVVHSPEWQPGSVARARGAEPVPASAAGPMGIAKIPFAAGGIALHGGAHPLLLGKPVSLGCVRTQDADLMHLIAWLGDRGALGKTRRQKNGESQQAFLRPARIVVR